MRRRSAIIGIGVCVVAAACGIDALGTRSTAPIEGDAAVTSDRPDDDGSPSDAAGTTDAAIDVVDGGSLDAAVDGPPKVVALCDAGSVHCNGVCVLADDCRLCANAKLFCARTRACAAGCTTCPERPIECFGCDSSQSNPVGTCQSFDAGGYCLNGDYGAGEHCDCSNTNVANCVGSQHVCLPASGTDWCVTCGEKGLATNGKACKGGGTCNTAKSPPGCE